MRSREIRSSFLEYFQRQRPHHRAELVARARRRPDAALHQRRDEPVQGRVPRPREARLHARHDLAEVHARQRQAQRPRQRRPVAAASHVLRDARQLLVRRLLQAGGDPVRVGAADDGLEAARRPAVSRPSSRARPASRATTRRTRSGRGSCPPTGSPSSAWPRTSGRWARPAPAAAAPRSTTSAATHVPCDEERHGRTLPAASTAAAIATSKSGTTCSWSSTARPTAR